LFQFNHPFSVFLKFDYFHSFVITKGFQTQPCSLLQCCFYNQLSLHPLVLRFTIFDLACYNVCELKLFTSDLGSFLGLTPSFLRSAVSSLLIDLVSRLGLTSFSVIFQGVFQTFFKSVSIWVPFSLITVSCNTLYAMLLIFLGYFSWD